MNTIDSIVIAAEPEPIAIDPARTAVIIIDMQRDFLERIGAQGPMGRILVRGEPGHAIISALSPHDGEPVIDKPGKGAFYATDLHAVLANRNIESLIVCGVTTEICVHTTVREANDRGFRCIVPADCCASYFPEFHRAGLQMIKAQGGILGWVSSATAVVSAFAPLDQRGPRLASDPRRQAAEASLKRRRDGPVSINPAPASRAGDTREPPCVQAR